MGNSKIHFDDRGPSITGYFVTDKPDSKILFGVEWENAWPCGSFVKDKKVCGVAMFHFFINELTDPKGQHAESFDMSVMALEEGVAKKEIGIAVLKEKPVDIAVAKTKLTVEKKALIDAAKYPTDPLLTAIEQSDQFLGYTFEQVVKDRPEVWQPTKDKKTGNDVPNIWKCSMEMAVPKTADPIKPVEDVKVISK